MSSSKEPTISKQRFCRVKVGESVGLSANQSKLCRHAEISFIIIMYGLSTQFCNSIHAFLINKDIYFLKLKTGNLIILNSAMGFPAKYLRKGN